MNAFFVPQLGSMIYTMNGMVTTLNLQADRTGDFLGLSSHFSGDGFPGMKLQVKAVEPAAFESWVANAKVSSAGLDRADYSELAKQSSNVARSVYGRVEAGLFDAIAHQELPPGPGPERGQPAVEVSPRSSAAICTPSSPKGALKAAPPSLRAGG